MLHEFPQNMAQPSMHRKLKALTESMPHSKNTKEYKNLMKINVVQVCSHCRPEFQHDLSDEQWVRT